MSSPRSEIFEFLGDMQHKISSWNLPEMRREKQSIQETVTVTLPKFNIAPEKLPSQ